MSDELDHPPLQPLAAPATGIQPAQHFQSILDKSRQRSLHHGLSPHEKPDYSRISRVQLQEALDENRFLFQHAAPIMENLHGQIANTHSMVLLTCARGTILHSLGDHDFLEKASRVALIPGIDWSERSRGTNAIGTALNEEEALTIHGGQHYMSINHSLTCSCAPIFDPYGKVVGALDVTGDHRSYHMHTLALVKMSAQMIENQMFAASFPKSVRIHFHSRAEFLGTLVEGIAVFSLDGRFIAANRSAQFQLGLSFNALQAYTFSSLFQESLSKIFDSLSSTDKSPQQLYLSNGLKVYYRPDIKNSAIWTHPHFSEIKIPKGDSQLPISSNPLPSLEALDTGDSAFSLLLQKLKKIIDKDIPILIQGETGTGKDLLANALHQASARARKPFVAVNCASIPDTLIEAELFGYEEGAFTGARKKGSIGKILQANGGTLFLDEIGDMPRHLQARLLRVLQEKKVSPLGAGKEVSIDIKVISATHKNLKEMIPHGDFREDLYYRLNGIVVRLPALRERTDFEYIAKKIVAELSDRTPSLRISYAVMAMLKGYAWPGNIRQLHNLLRTAVVMASDDAEIGLEHLPDDFVEDQQNNFLSEKYQIQNIIQNSLTEKEIPNSTPECKRLEDMTLHAMEKMLVLHKGNVSAAAKALGVSRNTIYRKKNLLPSFLK